MIEQMNYKPEGYCEPWENQEPKVLMPSLLAEKQAVLEENKNQSMNHLKQELQDVS